MVINSKINFRIRTAKSRIHGKGSFATEVIPARKKIGSLGGVVISKNEARRRAAGANAIAIVELWNGKAIDASDENGLRYVNHSCTPNTFLRTFNYNVEFYSLRKIEAGEELTCNYGPTHHDGKLRCSCGAENCRGKI